MLTKDIFVPKLKPYAVKESYPVQEKVIRPGKKFDYNLEALRGIAALLVVIGHLIEHRNYLNPLYSPRYLTNFGTPSHLSVLIFFVLSGYVIGISNKQRLTGRNIFTYLKKRLVRLYPIYFLCLLFTLLVAFTKYSSHTIISNFTFTQILFSDVIWEDNPIWSLNYEVLYYLIFIPVSFFDIDPVILTLSSTAIGLGNRFLYPQLHTPLLTSYFYGFAFWTTGLIIAKYFTRNEKKINLTLLVSNVFLILGITNYNLLSTLLKKLTSVLFRFPVEFPHTINWYERAIAFADLAYLPYCLMFVLVFSGNEFKYRKQIFSILQIIPVFIIAYKMKNGGLHDVEHFIIPSVYYVISMMLYFDHSNWMRTVSNHFLKGAVWLGSVSYGLYIVHFPLLVLFKRCSFFSGSAFTFFVRFLLFIAIALFLSYLLERKFQPWIKQRLA